MSINVQTYQQIYFTGIFVCLIPKNKEEDTR